MDGEHMAEIQAGDERRFDEGTIPKKRMHITVHLRWRIEGEKRSGREGAAIAPHIIWMMRQMQDRPTF